MPLPLAVLLDLDGTLVDTLDLLLSSARHAFTGRTGRVPTDAEWRAGIGTPLHRQMEPFATDPADLDLLVTDYRTFQREHHDRLTILYPGVRAVVHTLRERGHAMAVVTSKSDEIASRTLRHVGLADDLQVVVGADSSPRHKPDPEPVRIALDRLGRDPGEAIFVGDAPFDIQAGVAAGVTTVGALWGFFTRDVLEEVGAHFCLESISELPALVEQIGAM